MKKSALKIVLLAAVIVLYSCGNQKKKNINTPQTEEDSKIEVVESHKGTGIEMSLDQGKLWEANKETTDGVQNMIKLMKNFSEKQQVDAYEKLTEKLKQEFAMIFEKCTMKGEAHNQLHNFLIPIKGLFGELSSKDLNKCKKSFNKLNMHLAVYKSYFE